MVALKRKLALAQEQQATAFLEAEQSLSETFKRVEASEAETLVLKSELSAMKERAVAREEEVACEESLF